MKPTGFPDRRKAMSPHQVKGQDASFHSWSWRAEPVPGAQPKKKSQLSAGRSPRRTSGGKAVTLMSKSNLTALIAAKP
jgi:hypothetical protein